MTGLNPATYSDLPKLRPTQVVCNPSKVSTLDLSQVRCFPWLPKDYLEDYLCPQATSTALVKTSSVKDTKNAFRCSTATNIANRPPKVSILSEIGFNLATTTDVQGHNQSLFPSGSIFTVNDFNIVPTMCRHEGKLNFAKDNIGVESINTTKISTGQYSTAEDNLCGQIGQLGELRRKMNPNHVNSSDECDCFRDGISMEGTLQERGNPKGELMENSSMAKSPEITRSPKAPRKSTDIRRRRKKANEREKQRIVVLQSALNVLKNSVPAAREKTKITKLEVLQLAREYINSLRVQLMDGSVEAVDDDSCKGKL